MSERNRYDLRRGVIHRARAEDVYPEIEDGTVRLVISDGPYGLKIAPWDMMRVDALVEWYRPHVEAWGRICMPSASVYVWGTPEGWQQLDSLMRENGWTFRTLFVWFKPNHQAQKSSEEQARQWFDMIEVCGFYQRNEWEMESTVASAGQHIAYAAGRDDRNWIREWLCEEWKDTGLRNKDIDVALGTNGMAGHYLGASQWSLPTWEAYQTIARHAAEHGAPRARPYLVHPSCWRESDPDRITDPLRSSFDHLRDSFEMLMESCQHLRDEYETKRVPFHGQPENRNVWIHGVLVDAERLRDGDGKAVHHCQKPLLFADRMIRASTNPGDLVLSPFAGTCREAVACERMQEPEARRYICIEMDEDGREYIAAVLPSLRLESPKPKNERQLVLGW